MKLASGTNNNIITPIKRSHSKMHITKALPLVTSASFILNDFKFFNYLLKRDLKTNLNRDHLKIRIH